MIESNLFNLAFGLQDPWHAEDLRFSTDKKRLDIYIDFGKGSEFNCPTCSDGGTKAYDSKKASWRHLTFFSRNIITMSYLIGAKLKFDLPT